MMWWDGNGWSWWWMGLSMVLFWVIVGIVIWAIVRAGQDRREPRRDTNEILAERFARGEISAEEYEERKQVLAKR